MSTGGVTESRFDNSELKDLLGNLSASVLSMKPWNRINIFSLYGVHIILRSKLIEDKHSEICEDIFMIGRLFKLAVY